ncbi:hypothetical protein ETAA8_28360 [Anatilimnocola aggregata]|uniref:Uncharacterized protein n=1 Tax=Anatilimnocola aggregata TaxID=2528021 RepID=A0A517YBX0_9BACT|nr:hypothetical protein ETAA8_28360 [Anatilimnocola aggregata]
MERSNYLWRRMVPAALSLLSVIASLACLAMAAMLKHDTLFSLALALMFVGIPYLTIIGLSISLCGIKHSRIGWADTLPIPSQFVRSPGYRAILSVPGRFSASAPFVVWKVCDSGIFVDLSLIGEFFIDWTMVSQIECSRGRLSIIHESSEFGSPLITSSSLFPTLLPFITSIDVPSEGGVVTRYVPIRVKPVDPLVRAR